MDDLWKNLLAWSLCGLLRNLQHVSGCRQRPQAFTYVGQVSWNNSTVLRDSSSSSGSSCWLGNGTLLEVVTARAATCMTVPGCKAFTLEPNLKGLRSCLLTSAPDVYTPSLDVSCYGVFYKVDGTVQAWGRPNASPSNIPDDAAANVAAVYSNGWTAYALLNTGKVVAWVSTVAAGDEHALALLEDGTVVAWGHNDNGQVDVPPLPKVVAIAAGRAYSLALLENGTVVAWGYEYEGITTVPPYAQANVAAIAAGHNHVLVLLNNGTVVAWGGDFVDEESMAVPKAAQANVTAIAAGLDHSLALLSNGTVVAWGDDRRPLLNTELSDVKTISAGPYNAIALLRNGTVVAWGDNEWGQCNISIDVPAIGVAVGEGVSLVLLQTGTVVAFGYKGAALTQIPVVAQFGVSAIGCGGVDGDRSVFSCQALLSNSTVVAWAASKQTWNVSGVTAVATADSGHFAAAFANGTSAWSINSFMQNLFTSHGDVNTASVTTSSYRLWTLLTNSTLVGFGLTSLDPGVLYSEPESSIVAVSGWGDYIMTLLVNGTVRVWNLFSYLELGDVVVPSAALSDVVAIGAGGTYHVALLGNGTLVVWNVGTTNLVNLPKNFQSDIVRVSTGTSHILAQKSDGQLIAYGLDNTYKQLAVPATVANGQLQAFVCGDDVSFAIMTPKSLPLASQGPSPMPAPRPPPPPRPPAPVASAAPVVSAPQPSEPNSMPSDSSSSSSKGPIIGAAVGASAGAILLAGLAWLLVRRKRRQQPAEQASTFDNSPEAVITITTGSKQPNTSSTGISNGSKQTSGSSNPTSSMSLSKYNSRTIYQAEVLRNLQLSWADIKLGKAIGAGGFGTVYRARWRGDQVAVKMLNVAQLSEAYRAALRQEALSMVDLRHPRIVPVYGLIDDGEHCALVMKYFRGGTLATAISNPEYSSLKKTVKLNIALQVAGGMQYLHDKDMLHGDLKTSNLLVDDAKGVAITDFGLSRVAGQSVASAALTVQISPPEVLLDPSAPRTKAGDVYAFGIVLFEIISGVLAFKSMNRGMIRDAVCAGQRPGLVGFDIPDQVADIISMCWAQDAAARPSFTEVTARLEAAMQNGVQEQDHNMDAVEVHTTTDTATMPWAFAGP